VNGQLIDAGAGSLGVGCFVALVVVTWGAYLQRCAPPRVDCKSEAGESCVVGNKIPDYCQGVRG
jgi:hypothetical protein